LFCRSSRFEARIVTITLINTMPAERFAALDLLATLVLVVQADDRVLFAKYSGTEYKVDEIDYLVLAEKDILGVIEA
jgi:hypothetical protein